MNYSNVKQIVLTEEQEQFFIETWENNSSYLAHLIIKEQLGLSLDKIDVLAKNLREEGKIRDKQRHKFSNSELETFKREHEEGLSINEIASMHQRDAKAIRRHLKVMYGGKIPKIIKNTRQGEIWKDIEGCDTHQVSDKGRIYVKSTNQIIYGYITINNLICRFNVYSAFITYLMCIASFYIFPDFALASVFYYLGYLSSVHYF